MYISYIYIVFKQEEEARVNFKFKWGIWEIEAKLKSLWENITETLHNYTTNYTKLHNRQTDTDTDTQTKDDGKGCQANRQAGKF